MRNASDQASHGLSESGGLTDIPKVVQSGGRVFFMGKNPHDRGPGTGHYSIEGTKAAEGIFYVN